MPHLLHRSKILVRGTIHVLSRVRTHLPGMSSKSRRSPRMGRTNGSRAQRSAQSDQDIGANGEAIPELNHVQESAYGAFRRMPLEVRDMIYDLLIDDRDKFDEEAFGVINKNEALPSLALVNKTFLREVVTHFSDYRLHIHEPTWIVPLEKHEQYFMKAEIAMEEAAREAHRRAEEARYQLEIERLVDEMLQRERQRAQQRAQYFARQQARQRVHQQPVEQATQHQVRALRPLHASQRTGQQAHQTTHAQESQMLQANNPYLQTSRAQQNAASQLPGFHVAAPQTSSPRQPSAILPALPVSTAAQAPTSQPSTSQQSSAIPRPAQTPPAVPLLPTQGQATLGAADNPAVVAMSRPIQQPPAIRLSPVQSHATTAAATSTAPAAAPPRPAGISTTLPTNTIPYAFHWPSSLTPPTAYRSSPSGLPYRGPSALAAAAQVLHLRHRRTERGRIDVTRPCPAPRSAGWVFGLVKEYASFKSLRLSLREGPDLEFDVDLLGDGEVRFTWKEYSERGLVHANWLHAEMKAVQRRLGERMRARHRTAFGFDEVVFLGHLVAVLNTRYSRTGDGVCGCGVNV